MPWLTREVMGHPYKMEYVSSSLTPGTMPDDFPLVTGPAPNTVVSVYLIMK